MKPNNELSQQPPMILFDGVCNFCNRWINFVIRHDSAGLFLFVPSTGETAKRLETAYAFNVLELNTVMVIDNERIYDRSDAVLFILSRLDIPIANKINWAYAIPKRLRDGIYKLIAKHRYLIAGKSNTCMLPTQAIRKRFLN
ncbi:thiol-disulfide oxidoreductase DCC family protein [Mucilaginibacter sp. MD40]|uniref:thiol-disulfide oxidoreductase DCC family protein n=1 Tax=Mucilaginibacter sp. MD40 TaxID=2029590 RepID=UPI0013043E16|nr:DCC1-like thiol-disulfide oxidoreductase family protein [Mucilaginibacter sp. MD40]